MSFANRITFTLSGIGGDVVTRFAFGDFDPVVRGLSLVMVDCSFTWRCFTPEGPRLPSVRARFLFLVIQFGVVVVALCLKKIIKECGIRFHQQLLQCGCHVLGWICCQKVVLKINSPYSLDIRNKFSLTHMLVAAQSHSIPCVLAQAWSKMDYYSRDSQEVHP